MLRLVLPFFVFSAVVASALPAQTQRFQPSQAFPSTRQDYARARMQPVGATSAVDRIRAQNRQRQGAAPSQSPNREFAATSPDGNQSQVRQVVMMQQAEVMTAPPLPTGEANVGGGVAAPTQTTTPNAAAPSLPINPNNAVPMTSSPSDRAANDFQQVPRPQLRNNGFATIDNCNCVSAPSAYSAASGIGCGTTGYIQTVGCNNVPGAAGYGLQPYTAPPAQIAAPAVMPQFPVAAGGYTQGGLGFPNGLPRSLISFGQQLNTVQVGQGLVGQPVAYVPGQTVRNWIRYLSP